MICSVRESSVVVHPCMHARSAQHSTCMKHAALHHITRCMQKNYCTMFYKMHGCDRKSEGQHRRYITTLLYTPAARGTRLESPFSSPPKSFTRTHTREIALQLHFCLESKYQIDQPERKSSSMMRCLGSKKQQQVPVQTQQQICFTRTPNYQTTRPESPGRVPHRAMTRTLHFVWPLPYSKRARTTHDLEHLQPD